MKPSCSLCSRSASSSRWIARARNDPFAHSSLYVARSAHKLIELDDRYRFLRGARHVLELGASPGGWTQVCLERLRGKGKVIAVDLKQLDGRALGHKNAEKNGLVAIVGDLQLQDTIDEIARELGGSVTGQSASVDVVLSDMLANTSGNTLRDTQASLDLCQLAVSLSELYLRRQPVAENGTQATAEKGGTLVMKILQSSEADQWRKEVLNKRFKSVKWEKPASSRGESKEGFLVCRDHLGVS